MFHVLSLAQGEFVWGLSDYGVNPISPNGTIMRKFRHFETRSQCETVHSRVRLLLEKLYRRNAGPRASCVLVLKVFCRDLHPPDRRVELFVPFKTRETQPEAQGHIHSSGFGYPGLTWASWHPVRRVECRARY